LPNQTVTVIRRSYPNIFGSRLNQVIFESGFVFYVTLPPPALDFVQGRLSNEEVAFFYQVRHLAVKKSQQQSSNVRAVHVSIRHDDNGMIAQLRRIVVFLYARTESGYHDANFLRGKHLVETRFFDIENLTLERQYRLIAPIPALFCR